jgi:hypothetical protein
MTANRIEIVSERFRWHSDTSEIEDARDNTRRKDSDYSAIVDVYEDRVRSWFLDIAVRETERQNAPGDYVALAVALA